MHRIWKFPVDITDTVTLKMPKDARILTVQVQDGIPCVWALCDVDAYHVERDFIVLGTGHPANDADASNYIGTFQLFDGQLVFHMFELK